MKYAIVINTYYRTDGKTKEYLSRTLNCVKNQTHQDYKVFLIGDKYENENEFYECANIIQSDKIVAVNLPYAKERELYVDDSRRLHLAGGVNARNIGLEMALLAGFDFIFNLDHDDIWDYDHIECIDSVIHQYKDAVFICTKAKHFTNEILPKINTNTEIFQVYPTGGDIILSSTCVNFTKIPIRFVDPYQVYNRDEASDAQLWTDMRLYMTQNGLSGYCYNKLTCHHLSEGEAHAN